jgi:RNA polymerase sigma factor (sigma-70 family)
LDSEVQTAMTALAAGDRAAFDVVFRALWPRCRAFARKLVDDAELADDAAQQALMQLFAQSTRFDANKSAVSWALTLTAWQARTVRRRRERRREDGVDHALAPSLACPSPSPEDRVVDARLVAQALDVVDALSPTDREAVLRALDDDKSGDAAMRKRRQRAFDKLRAFWSTKYG